MSQNVTLENITIVFFLSLTSSIIINKNKIEKVKLTQNTQLTFKCILKKIVWATELLYYKTEGVSGRN